MVPAEHVTSNWGVTTIATILSQNPEETATETDTVATHTDHTHDIILIDR